MATAASNLKPFPKGSSGNPGGRPRLDPEVREIAKGASPDAVRTLVKIMNDADTPPAVRVAAANSILDRAYGKPAQPIDGDGEGGPILTSIEVRFIRPPATA